jgi:hypothetical protein
MDIQLKIDRLSVLLPGREIAHIDGQIRIDVGYCINSYSVSTPIVDITDDTRRIECFLLLYGFANGSETEYNVLSKYYSIVNFEPSGYSREITDVLKHLIKNQQEKEVLLEEVLRSKTNIGGLIENRLRSFIYYNTPI